MNILKCVRRFSPIIEMPRGHMRASMKNDHDGPYLLATEVEETINPNIQLGQWAEETRIALTHFAVQYQNHMSEPEFVKKNGWKQTAGEWSALFQLYLAENAKQG